MSRKVLCNLFFAALDRCKFGFGIANKTSRRSEHSFAVCNWLLSSIGCRHNRLNLQDWFECREKDPADKPRKPLGSGSLGLPPVLSFRNFKSIVLSKMGLLSESNLSVSESNLGGCFLADPGRFFRQTVQIIMNLGGLLRLYENCFITLKSSEG